MVFRPGPYQFPSDEVLWLDGESRARWELKRWSLLWRAMRRFDVVHFNFGQTLMPTLVDGARGGGWGARLASWYRRMLEQIDLPLLKRAGVKIAVTFQGDDARQGAELAKISEFDLSTELEPGYYDPISDEAKRRRIARFERHADLIYALNPDLFRVLPARTKFLAYPTVDLDASSPTPRDPNATPVLLHAPTHRGIKGTKHVLAAVETLRAEGIPFEFRLIEGKTWLEARQAYREADLVVDQIILGWYGGFALENMSLGKPVVCHLRKGDLRFLPPQLADDLPLIDATPQTICDVLREWLTTRRGALAEQGRLSRAYAERWHDPRRIAGEVVADYRRAVGRPRDA